MSACSPGLLSVCFGSDEHWGARVTQTRANEHTCPPGKQCGLGSFGVEVTPAIVINGGNVADGKQVFRFQMD